VMVPLIVASAEISHGVPVISRGVQPDGGKAHVGVVSWLELHQLGSAATFILAALRRKSLRDGHDKTAVVVAWVQEGGQERHLSLGRCCCLSEEMAKFGRLDARRS
jgi:hypothetical protein